MRANTSVLSESVWLAVQEAGTSQKGTVIVSPVPPPTSLSKRKKKKNWLRMSGPGSFFHHSRECQLKHGPLPRLLGCIQIQAQGANGRAMPNSAALVGSCAAMFLASSLEREHQSLRVPHSGRALEGELEFTGLVADCLYSGAGSKC